MEQGPPRRRRARPVADAPVDALLQRVEDLTKGWLLALLEHAPLDEAPAILAADLARDGPRICDAVVRALADDADLRRIERGGALERLVSQTGQFAGARGVEATSRAVDALGAVIWSGLRSELPRPDPDQISELAERLALVIELVRGAALRQYERDAPGPRPAGSTAPHRLVPDQQAERAPSPPGVPFSPRAVGSSAPGAAPAPTAAGARASAADTLWMGAVEDEIVRSERSGAPLSLMLVELEETERMLAVEPSGEAPATFSRFAQAVRSVVRRQDILACETDTRIWIIARDTGRLGARALGSRIAGAVSAAPPWRGAPMTVSVGLAVLGEDGRDCASLIDAAEESRFAAAANGLSVHVASPGHAGEPHDGPGPELLG